MHAEWGFNEESRSAQVVRTAGPLWRTFARSLLHYELPSSRTQAKPPIIPLSASTIAIPWPLTDRDPSLTSSAPCYCESASSAYALLISATQPRVQSNLVSRDATPGPLVATPSRATILFFSPSPSASPRSTTVCQLWAPSNDSSYRLAPGLAHVGCRRNCGRREQISSRHAVTLGLAERSRHKMSECGWLWLLRPYVIVLDRRLSSHSRCFAR
ncbi:hypothetical protein BDV96DRAFT_50856 [Lophiotrema nucula]|uniref:Uncharacterized protein n=1 Tax=Lophiotrema nucula TaxID=690887 RepID=A0A6A5ZAS3_9PLEO|nr:hypothetical protein BDV96DRAFT_50856 [Lophiotrema nucula]